MVSARLFLSHWCSTGCPYMVESCFPQFLEVSNWDVIRKSKQLLIWRYCIVTPPSYWTQVGDKIDTHTRTDIYIYIYILVHWCPIGICRYPGDLQHPIFAPISLLLKSSIISLAQNHQQFPEGTHDRDSGRGRTAPNHSQFFRVQALSPRSPQVAHKLRCVLRNWWRNMSNINVMNILNILNILMHLVIWFKMQHVEFVSSCLFRLMRSLMVKFDKL